MKFLVLILALLMAVPPVQAGVCAMNAGQESAAMADQGHDCCPGESSEMADEDPACDGSSHCGACVTGTAAISSAVQNLFDWDVCLDGHPLAASLPPSHDSPPYRPPIS